MEQREVYGVIAYRRPNHKEGLLRKRDFIYNQQNDGYRCPAGQTLVYRTTTREGYREYASDRRQCQDRPLLSQCTRSTNRTKVITRHVWEESRERIAAHRLTVTGRAIYGRRKETVERSLADAKQLHGHRYARMRGQLRGLEQCLLAAAVKT